jgi:hypothetical protein
MKFEEYISGQDLSGKTDEELSVIKRNFFVKELIPAIRSSGGDPSAILPGYVNQANSVIAKHKKVFATGSKSIAEYNSKLQSNLIQSLGDNIPVIGPAVKIIDDVVNKRTPSLESALSVLDPMTPVTKPMASMIANSIGGLVSKFSTGMEDAFRVKKTGLPKVNSLEGMTQDQIRKYNQDKSRIREYDQQGLLGLGKEIGEGLLGGAKNTIVGVASGADTYVPASLAQERASAISTGFLDLPAYGIATAATKSPVAGFAIPDAIRQVAVEFQKNPEKWNEMDALEKANYIASAFNRTKDAAVKGGAMGASFSGTGAVVEKQVGRAIGESISKPVVKTLIAKPIDTTVQAGVMTALSGDWSASGYLNNFIVAAGLNALGAGKELAVKGAKSGITAVKEKVVESKKSRDFLEISDNILHNDEWLQSENQKIKSGEKTPTQSTFDALKEDRHIRFADKLIDHVSQYTGLDGNVVSEAIKTPEGMSDLAKIYRENRILNEPGLTENIRDKYKTSPELMKKMIELQNISDYKKKVGDKFPKSMEDQYMKIREEAGKEFYRLNEVDPGNTGYAQFIPEMNSDFRGFKNRIDPIIKNVKPPDVANSLYRSPYENMFVEREVKQKTNSNIADYLSDIARFSPDKAEAYNAAAKEIRGMDGEIKNIDIEKMVDTLTPLGITPDVAKVVSDIVRDGKSKALADAQMKGQYRESYEELKYLTPKEIDKLSPDEMASFLQKAYYSADGRRRADIDPERVSSMLKDYVFEKEIMSKDNMRPEDLEKIFSSEKDKVMMDSKAIEGVIKTLQIFADNPKKLNPTVFIAKAFKKKAWDRTIDLLTWFDKKIGGNSAKNIIHMDMLQTQAHENLSADLTGRFEKLFGNQPKRVLDLADRMAGLEPELFAKRSAKIIKDLKVSPDEIETARILALGKDGSDSLRKISKDMIGLAKKLDMTALKDGKEVPISEVEQEYYSPDLAHEKFYEPGTKENAQYLNWLYQEGLLSGKYDQSKRSEAEIRRLVRKDFEQYKANLGKHRHGTLEYSKELPKFPEEFLRDTRSRWLETIDGSTNRFAEIMHWGAKYEKLDKAFNDFIVDAATHLDAKSAAIMVQSTQDFIRTITNKRDIDAIASNLTKAAGTYLVLAKLPLVAISQFSQFPEAMKAGSLKSFLRGIKAMTTDKQIKFQDPNIDERWTMKELRERSGSASQYIMNLGIRKTFMSNRITDKYLRWNQMYRLDAASRAVANASGWFFAEELSHQMNNILAKHKVMGSAGEMSPEAQLKLLEQKGGGIFERVLGAKENTYLVRKMRQMGIEPAEVISRGRNAEGKYTLNQEQQINAARIMETETNYRNFARDLPSYAKKSPLMSMIYLFKSYGFNKWQNIKTNVIGEAKRGNLFPLFYMAVVDFGIVAPVINTIASLIRRKDPALVKLARGVDDYGRDYNVLDYAFDMMAGAGIMGKWETPVSAFKYKRFPTLTPGSDDAEGLFKAMVKTYEAGGTTDATLEYLASLVPIWGRSVLVKQIQDENAIKRGKKRWLDKGYDEEGASAMYQIRQQKYGIKKMIDEAKGIDKTKRGAISNTDFNKTVKEYLKNQLHDLGIYD